jgi:hypothetical protein
MENYKSNIKLLSKYSIERLHSYMIDALGYSQYGLDEWDDKSLVLDLIVTTSDIYEVIQYLGLPELSKHDRVDENGETLKVTDKFIRSGDHVLVNTKYGAAYNLATIENTHLPQMEKHISLLLAAPDLLDAVLWAESVIVRSNANSRRNAQDLTNLVAAINKAIGVN